MRGREQKKMSAGLHILGGLYQEEEELPVSSAWLSYTAARACQIAVKQRASVGRRILSASGGVSAKIKSEMALAAEMR